MSTDESYHSGERWVQACAGERQAALRNASVVGDRIAPRARAFVSQQFMAVLGAEESSGLVWASLLFGEPGFASADEFSVTFDLNRVTCSPDDPLWSALGPKRPIGLLFIDLATRRRLRVNGEVVSVTDESLAVQVREAYPNCPKYIQRRQLRLPDGFQSLAPGLSGHGRVLTRAPMRILERSDTFFVATVHPKRGADVSHRGGLPGFVNIVSDRLLRIPDYPGNSMFNTLGNLRINPSAGLVFPDFEAGTMLQMTGSAELRFDVEDSAGLSGGTRRFWDFRVDRWLLTEAQVPTKWEFLDYSPVLPGA